MSAILHIASGSQLVGVDGLLKCFVNFFGCHGSSPLGYAPEGAAV